jgi:putative DNA primase/helicase
MIEFSTTFKMFLDCNHIPGIGSGDEAMWDRTILIPFSERISDDEINRDLQEELKEEAAGILAWAVRGCLRYQEEGLNPPKGVTNAGQEYRKENDLYGRFLEEHCVVKEGLEVATSTRLPGAPTSAICS